MEQNRLRPRSESGQGLVEFALLLPVLLVILLAIVQFGFLYHDYVTITDATRAGVRTAVVSRGSGNPVAAAEAAVRASASGLDQDDLQVVVSPPPPWSTGQQISVTASYPYSIDLAGVAVQSGMLTSSTTERVE